MPHHINSHEKKVDLRIEGNFSIYELKGLRDELLEVLKNMETIEIDFGKLDEIDTPGLQFIISLVKTCDENSITVVFRENPVFAEFIKGSGENLKEILIRGA